MIISTYGDISLLPQLHQQLEALFQRYSLPDDVKTTGPELSST